VSFDQVGSLIAEMDISWLGYTLSEILINVMKAFGPIGLAIAAFSSEVGNTIKQGARFVTAGATGGASIATNSIRQTKSTIHKSSEAYKAHQQRKKEKNYVRPELRI
jgi:flagellar motor component MotA